MTQAEYAAGFKDASEKYFAVTEEIAQSELPNKQGLSREERTKILSEHIRTQNGKIRNLAEEFKLLRPPANYESLHQAYLALLNGQVERDNKYAAAIAADDGILAEELTTEYMKFLRSQMGVILDEMEKAGGDVSKLREEFDKMMKEAQTLAT